jgi:mutator protein MutT
MLRESTKTPTPQPVQIAVGAVLRAEAGGPRVLICKRPEEAIRGGLWEFPGGKIEPGEAPEAAAVREVLEETGLVLDVRQAHLVTHLLHHEAHAPVDGTLEIVLVAFQAPAQARPEPLASTECRWEYLDALDAYAWPEANAKLISRLRAWTREHPLAEAIGV